MLASKGKSGLSENFFDEIGGFPVLRRVHNLLYTKLFAHPWLGGFFERTKREIVEAQQTDFWASLMGGPGRYCGRSPRDAHVHMFLSVEAFGIRNDLLRQSLVEAGVPPELREKWLALDANFEKALSNKMVSECRGRYRSEPVVRVQKPEPGKSRTVELLPSNYPPLP